MVYYHGSPIAGLMDLMPSRTKYFGKPRQVCMTTLRSMALFYLIDNFEYAYGYDGAGNLMYEEYFPDALQELYGGKPGYLYLCEEGEYQTTDIPNERVSEKPVKIIGCEFIPDACEAIFKAEREGKLFIRRYRDMKPQDISRVERFISADIREKELWKTDTPKARYVKQYYPGIWEKTITEVLDIAAETRLLI